MNVDISWFHPPTIGINVFLFSTRIISFILMLVTASALNNLSIQDIKKSRNQLFSSSVRNIDETDRTV